MARADDRRTALVTSISSIAIAVHHGQTMEKLVQANSVPFVIGGFSDITPDGQKVLSLDLLNRGAGPAKQRSLRVKVDGRYVTSLPELLTASLGPEQAQAATKPLNFSANKVKMRFLPPGNVLQMVFRTARTPENAQYWEQLQAAQPRWSLEYCYCSVFEECWFVPNKWEEPQPVDQCVRDEPNEFLP
jgi:hypothetical protein